jgi:hypothetical protein
MKNKAMPTKKIIEVIKKYYPEASSAYDSSYYECYWIKETKEPKIVITYADTPYPKHTPTYTSIGRGITERKAWVKAMEHVIKEHNLDY